MVLLLSALVKLRVWDRKAKGLWAFVFRKLNTRIHDMRELSVEEIDVIFGGGPDIIIIE